MLTGGSWAIPDAIRLPVLSLRRPKKRPEKKEVNAHPQSRV